ncbi:MAG: OadG family protein [Proteobacteria bacterium]|nr:OadG family protein [Pseudomonadota bacterium]
MDNLLNQGLELAMFGMGTVFVFLALLIAATKTMSALVLKFQPALADTVAPVATRSSLTPEDGQLVAVISAAIMRHRNKNQ